MQDATALGEFRQDLPDGGGARGPGRSAWYWWTSMTREALGLVGLVALVSESAMVNRV